ncbi:MAG: FkbM family methyltransferase [Cyanobacteria bacterium]|nr:FkbM family methyltransferase [Cyanobacteriota bacterium]MDW8200086.1 FkbM family methyltransferase [Cyanobacteriota bacterium SKYGB_h_bin112]
MNTSTLVIHHVGGRWGNRSFPVLPMFESDFLSVLYDADTDAIAGIHTANQALNSQQIVLPICLAEADGPKTLYISLNPGCTSLLSPGTAWDSHYINLFGIDMDFPHGSRIIEERPINARSLDSFLADDDCACPPPDFLSLDTQGSEYEILQGALKTLKHHVCGLVIEVEFVELYQGQKRFQDICDFLHELGFSFVRFLSIGELSGPKAPLGFRGIGYQTWADALFLRRPEKAIQDINPDHFERFIRKLCFIATVYGQIELVILCFNTYSSAFFKQRNQANALINDRPKYDNFLDDLFTVYEQAEKVFPPVFSEHITQGNCQKFAAANVNEQYQILGLEQLANPQFITALAKLQSEDDTLFEQVLRNYGFTDLATQLNYKRRDQVFKAKTAISHASTTASADSGVKIDNQELDVTLEIPKQLNASTKDKELCDLQENIQLLQQLIDANAQILAMESSKFWKLRRKWLQLKNIIGLY